MDVRDYPYYLKRTKKLQEGDLVALDTPNGLVYYFMDTCAYTDMEIWPNFEVFYYQVNEEEVKLYMNDSDISFTSVYTRMDLWELGKADNYVVCLK